MQIVLNAVLGKFDKFVNFIVCVVIIAVKFQLAGTGNAIFLLITCANGAKCSSKEVDLIFTFFYYVVMIIKCKL